MNHLTTLTYSNRFKELFIQIKNPVSNVLHKLENSKLFINYTDIDIVPNTDKVSFKDISKGVTITIKIGRFINKIITDSGIDTKNRYASGILYCEQKDIENFVYLYKAFNCFDEFSKKFEIVSGEDIRKWYLEDNNISIGTLGESCMRYENCQPFLDIYALNPEQINLLILKDNTGNKIVGRALIWKNIYLRVDGVETKEVINFMDRIYYNNDSIAAVFKLWAKNNSHYYKLRQDCDDLTPIVKDNVVHNKFKLFFYLNNGSKSGKYPFVDTLCNYSVENNFISNRAFKRSISLCNVDGSYEGNDND